jgi:hypothetical protein
MIDYLKSLTPFQLANLAEAGLWISLAIGVAIKALLRPPSSRFSAIIATVTLLAFGISDVVEMRTGAWWRPRWLLLWKGGCVAVFLVLLIRHFRKAASGFSRPAGQE